MTVATPQKRGAGGSNRDILRDVWLPKRPAPLLPWVEKNVWLSRRFTNREGFYSCGFTPYLRPFYQWFEDDETRTIAVPKGAQTGFTTALANVMSWAICERPGPILYATSNADNAKSWSEREWLPRIDDCPPLKRLKPADADLMRRTEQHFLSCTVKLVGAQSESQLASRPIRYLMGDEIDKWPSEFVGQAEARVLSYKGLYKVVRGSTPSDVGGAIDTAWLKSTQHRWHIPCPECREPQALDFFKHIKWPAAHRDMLGHWDLDAVRADAHAICEKCGAIWKGNRKNELVGSGEAIATNPHASPRDKGILLSSLLSPHLSWGDLAVLFLQKKDEPGGLRDFFNQYLGLPWEEPAAKVGEAKLLALRRDDYRLKQLPCEPVILTLCADVGQTRTHWSVEARTANGEAFVIDYGTVLVVEDLIPLMDSLTYTSPSGRTHRPSAGLVDSGGEWTTRVYATCAASRGRLWPSKGSSASFGSWGRSIVQDFPGLTLYTYVDFTAKCSLYLEGIGRQLPPRLWWPADVGHDFIAGHSGQEMRTSRTPRGSVKFWKPIAEDHFGDCSKLHRVASWILHAETGCFSAATLAPPEAKS